MIRTINRFRNDSRMVAPLAVIAIVVVGYVFKQSMGFSPPPKVRVTEVRPEPQAQDTPRPAPLTEADGVRFDPYYNAALQGSANVEFHIPEPAEGMPGEMGTPELGGMAGLFGRQAANLAALARAQQRRIQSEIEEIERPPYSGGPIGFGTVGSTSQPPPTGTPGGLLAPLKVLGAVETEKPPEKPEAPPEPEPEPELPEYHLVAVLQGPNPMAILTDEQGATLYPHEGDRLPTGERVKVLHAQAVGLLGAERSRWLDLREGAAR